MRVKVEKLDNLGRGITYINDKICFIDNALEGEVVEIKIVNDKKKYSEAKVINYIETSKSRIEAKCPYYKECGGCDLEHISLQDEESFKIQKVKDLIKKYVGIDVKIEEIVSPVECSYRNKLTLHSDGKIIGLYKKRSHDILAIDECLICNDKINDIIKLVKDIKNISKVEIRTSNNQEEVMVCIEGDISDNSIKSLLAYVDVLEVNDKIVSNKSSIITNIGEKKYYLSPKSFFQVNSYTTKELYSYIKDIVSSKDYSNIVDLYCGTGSIGIYISNDNSNIIGIDISKNAIEDANKNKELNNVKNISFINNDVSKEIDNLSKNTDLIIVDPPRSGLDDKSCLYLLEILPKEIIYVSCDPLTLARDLKILNDKYKIKSIKLFNMFPRTSHCESVCILERRQKHADK